jgi:halogenation protein CepH
MHNDERSPEAASLELGSYDVVVLGGGPSGSAAATILAQQGRRVLVVEKERFPRYHIGESLIPGCLRALNLLGVREEVERAGFVKKRGVTFAWGSEESWSISFDEQKADPNYAFHVERAKFDQILLRHAARAGAEVREGTAVRSVDLSQGDPLIHTDAGIARARYVVDASGQASLLGRKVGERRFDESLRNVALWQYFRGAGRLPPPKDGHIAVVRHGDGWWWYIPLEAEAGGLTSVGLVMSGEAYKRHGASAEDVFARARAEAPRLAGWLAHATPTSEVKTTSDWSYRSQRVAGDRWLLAGDAAGFVDPLLSTGCYMALTAGYLAGTCLGSVLRDPSLKAAAFRYFDASYNRVVDEIHSMVRVFYKTIRPQQAFDGARAILGEESDPRELFVRLAAGNVEESPAAKDPNYFQDTGLPSEVFGSTRKAPDRYGVPFDANRERVLGPVEDADLPPGVVGPMVLVELHAQLRMIPASEVVELPEENSAELCDLTAARRDEPGPTAMHDIPMAPPEPQQIALKVVEVTTEQDAQRLIIERLPSRSAPSAVLAYRDPTISTPVVVGFAQAEEGQSSWARVGNVSLVYFTDDDMDPFGEAKSRALLEEILRVAKACPPPETASPASLLQAVAAHSMQGNWRVSTQAVAPPPS